VFDTVVGQEQAKEILISMVESGRVPHALLFAGPHGVGKGEAARELARMLLCVNGPASGCTACGSCRRAAKLIHPDLHVLFPFRARPSNKELEARWLEEFQKHRLFIADNLYPTVVYEKDSKIVVGLVDEIRVRLLETSFEGGRRVCMILSADRLNQPTGNKLLKVLEEPPPDVHFILTAERVSSVLPTIVSRATVLRFRRLTVSEIAGYLERYPELTPEERMSSAIQGDGGIKAAKTFALEGAADLREQAFAIYGQVAFGSPDSVISHAAPLLWSKEAPDTEELIRGFARCTKAVVEWKAGVERDGDTRADRERMAGLHSDAVRRLAGRADLAALARLSKRLEDGLEMLGRNVNISLVMTTLLYTIHDTYR
jgi:DNA polymerase-3 subunit delta'